jgi:hypothetical protein
VHKAIDVSEIRALLLEVVREAENKPAAKP